MSNKIIAPDLSGRIQSGSGLSLSSHPQLNFLHGFSGFVSLMEQPFSVTNLHGLSRVVLNSGVLMVSQPSQQAVHGKHFLEKFIFK